MSIIGQPIMAGGGGVTANILVKGDVASSDTCYATKSGVQKNGVYTQVENPASHQLPSGYTEVEWIQSSGTQYILTGILPSSVTDTTEVEAAYLGGDVKSALFGSAGSDGAYLINKTTTSNQFRLFLKNGYDTNYTFSDYSSFHSYKLDKEKLYIDDTLKVTSSVTSTSDVQLAIFGHYNGTAASMLGNWKIKPISIIRNGSKIFWGIPCQDTDEDSATYGEYGLYDKIGGEFHGNAGTGVFTAGSVIPSTIPIWNIKGIKDYGTWTVSWHDQSSAHTYTEDVLIDVITTYEVEIEV